MAGETDLEKLLALMQPELLDGEYVFCSVEGKSYGDYAELNPLSSFLEAEGLSLLLSKASADKAQLQYESVFRGITLAVHSSLDAVGFTAAVSNKLANNGIPSNVVAAHFHDHVFVPAEKAELALHLLTELEE
ncbi:MAG: ACT domain-containing protein [Gammaproteobacteria bacterium]|nr:ACT domain-containing protein [Gammaproteobacteria bacterium]MDD9896417.1 ACT domain-containing protein [Gammaproteobacteria bacterium]MDD9959512.1 ACT domain-containing protein [Gammaproteobacteria bacterium]